MGIKYLAATAVAMAALTITGMAAPTAQGGSFGGGDHVNPHSGGDPGRYWHVEDASITWPTHTIYFTANYTQEMPGWNPTWAPGNHFNIQSKITPEVGTGIQGHIHNKCSSTINVQTAIGAEDWNKVPVNDPLDRGTVAIAPGATYSTLYRPVINGKGGISVKLGKHAIIDPGNVYLTEYAQHANGNGNMAIWYDLSSLKGNPFRGVSRYLQVGGDGTCTTLYNPPNSNVDDWVLNEPHTQKECENLGDVNFYLC